MLKNLFRRSDNNTKNDTTSNDNLFWKKFREYSSQNTSLEILEPNQKRNDYFGFQLKGFEQKEAHLTAWKGNGLIGVFVVLQTKTANFNAGEMFDKLQEHKEVIETTLDIEDQWKWMKKPDFPSRGPMIGFYKTQANDEESFKWIIERLEMLNTNFCITIKILMNS